VRSHLAKLCGLIGLYVAGWTIAAAAPGYQYSIVGNPGDVVTPTSGLLVGARAGGGDFVVIRASGTDAYNPYIYDLCPCDSVATIVFKKHNAAFNRDRSRWRGTGGIAYTLTVEAGVLTSSRGEIY
jgi:hypothetical protein